MSIQMYPLKFEPIYQYRIWGGRKFEHLLSKPLPENEPIGEAWLLSDRKDFSNTVTDGILKNTTLTPRIAMARSKDLFNWERMGLVCFTPYKTIDFNNVDDKDASFFPVNLPSPHNHNSIAMLHRPLFPNTKPEETVKLDENRDVDIHKESIWISYFNLKQGKNTSLQNARFTSHYRLAHPVYPWENLKIGSGAPPILTKHGWLLIYHGVKKHDECTDEIAKYTYSVGVMILSETEPQKILYRSPKPILAPELEAETIGVVGDVVFPTGIDRRDDIGQPNRIDVYYGMADDRIGVAKMEIPDQLPNAF